MKTLLIRQVIGETIREARMCAAMTLREVSDASAVSLGYLSEIERGHKEASSEVLSAITSALGVSQSELILRVGAKLAEAEVPLRPVALAA